MTRWFAAVPAATQVPDAHLVAAVDRALDESGARAERIHTHVDRSGPVAVTAVSILLDTDTDAAQVDTVVARLTAELDGPATADGHPDPDPRAARAITSARDGLDGRCVRFPGQGAATGEHAVRELLDVTGLDLIVGVGRVVSDADVVATGGFLRPTLQDGALMLLVEPAAGGRLQPIEVESPHQCCGGAH